MTTNVYSTACTTWFINAQQAVPAGGAPVNLMGGTLKVGDGNGVVPTISQIIANGGVLHQVWAGVPNGISVDATNTGQIDVNCLIPTVDATGAEIGPFNVTEFAIYDATGNLCIVGTTNLQKTVSAQGQLMTLEWDACYIAAASNAVTIMPPSGSFPTLGAIQTALAGLLSVSSPLQLVKTLLPSGWTSWALSIAKAFQPADATSASDAAAMGVGRPATSAEFAAGAPETGGYAWPWPTLQQIATAFSGYLRISGGSMTGLLQAASGFGLGVADISAATTFGTGDTGKLIQLGGSSAYATELATPAGNGGAFDFILNNSSSIQAITTAAGLFYGVGQPAAGSESLTLQPGQGALVWSDSFNWEVAMLSGLELRPPPSNTFYVACASGSDANAGTSAAPFQTIAGAMAALSNKYFAAQINLVLAQSGNYPGASIATGPINSWNIYPASGVSATIVAATSAVNLGRGLTANGPVKFNVSNVSFATLYENISVSAGASATVSACELTMASGAFALGVYSLGSMAVYQNNTLSGAGAGLALVLDGSLNFGYLDAVTNAPCAVAAVGTPTFSSACINANDNAVVTCVSAVATFTGAATGPRYAGYNGSRISVAGAGANYLLGSTAGATDSQSTYG